jgi:hypothetical protein
MRRRISLSVSSEKRMLILPMNIIACIVWWLYINILMKSCSKYCMQPNWRHGRTAVLNQAVQNAGEETFGFT